MRAHTTASPGRFQEEVTFRLRSQARGGYGQAIGGEADAQAEEIPCTKALKLFKAPGVQIVICHHLPGSWDRMAQRFNGSGSSTTLHGFESCFVRTSYEIMRK